MHHFLGQLRSAAEPGGHELQLYNNYKHKTRFIFENLALFLRIVERVQVQHERVVVAVRRLSAIPEV